jgi:polar amino acid transport system ATP-binding protein
MSTEQIVSGAAVTARVAPEPKVDLAIEVRNAHKSYGANHVLNGLDLTIRHGEVAVILGRSGSGKSTLLRAINRLDTLDLGYVKVLGEFVGVRRDGDRLRELSDSVVREQRSHIGFVFQNFNLFQNLTILDNVAEGPIAHRRLSTSEARKRAQALLDRVGIGDKADAYPRQLSGGQQQRAAIARALALEPQVILFDEPTSALDPELVDEVLQVIKDLARTGATLVIVTHEIGFAREVADLVVFIDEGHVVEQGPPSQVIDAPRHPRTREFISKVL